MRLATIKQNGREIAGIVTAGGVFPVEALNAAKGTAWKTEMVRPDLRGADSRPDRLV